MLGIDETDTTTLPASYFFRSANSRLRDLAFILWKNSSDWEFDDSNYTDFPIATCDLVASQQDYAIPTTALSIERVEVMNNDGDYVPIRQIDKTDNKSRPHLEKYKEEGFPEEYDLIGNSILLFPTPGTSYITTTAGLRVYFSRDINEFAITDTATEPGVPKMFHPGIGYGVAQEFAFAKGMGEQTQQHLRYGVRKYETMLNEFISRRNKDRKVKIRPNVKSSI